MTTQVWGGRWLLAPLLALSASAAEPNAPARELPGPLADGAVLLPNQWQLRPAGEQVAVGDFPVNLALHPGGKFAAVLHCGYGPHEVVVLDLAKHTIVSRERVPEAFLLGANGPSSLRKSCENVHPIILCRRLASSSGKGINRGDDAVGNRGAGAIAHLAGNLTYV